MKPVKGQRWFWIFPSSKRSETIAEVKRTYHDQELDWVEVEIVAIKISNNPVDKVGATFNVHLSRFDTSEFEYLSGQDRP